MSEAKAAAEAAARTYSKAQVATVKTLGSIRRAAATPATARAMAVETRALAKVFPQEARAVAKDLREDAKHMTSIQARMKRQAPAARLVAAPPPTAVVARAAAANPIPAIDIQRFFGGKVTIPKAAKPKVSIPGGDLGTGPEPPSEDFSRPKKAKKPEKPKIVIPGGDLGTGPEPPSEDFSRPKKAKKEPKAFSSSSSSKREFEDDYAAYVKERTESGAAAGATRASIAAQAKDPRNQMARMFNAAHVDFLDADYTPVSYEDFHTKKMEDLARKAAAEAAKPDRYRKLLASAMKKIEDASEKVSKGPGKNERLFDIPASAPLKTLQALARDQNIKGFSGKSAADLKAMLEAELDTRGKQHATTHGHMVNAAERDAAHMKFLVEAHNMSDAELESRMATQNRKKDEAQAHINSEGRRIRADLTSKKLTSDEAAAQIRALNAGTRLFEDENKAIHMIIRDAIQFKKTGTSRLLEDALSSVGVFYF